MKVGIITFQMAWNCGAVLQCAALKKKLEAMGHDVVVINYQPSYKDYKYCKYQNPITIAIKTWNISKLSPRKRLTKSIKAAGRAVINWNPKSGRQKQRRDFDVFCKDYLNLTQKYTSIEELRENPPECDIYISGSDQLWNPHLTNEKLDPAYFLDFGKDTVVRATYAISACELDIPSNKNAILRWATHLDKISLREEEKRDEIHELLQREVSVTIDPTLLLQAEDYSDFEKKENLRSSPYILVYALDNSGTNDVLFNSVKVLSDEKKIPVYVISGPHSWPSSVELYRPVDGISPSEFLRYIKDADVIVTNSFHATTFSIIYHKEFYTIGTPGRSSRVVELLEKMGLSDRLLFMDKNGKIHIENKNVDYNYVSEKIAEQQKQSLQYLESVLQQGEKRRR